MTGEENFDSESGSFGDPFAALMQPAPWLDCTIRDEAAGLDAFIGTPDIDKAFWVQQTTDFTCAVVAQQMILRQFGIEVSEAQLVYDATTHGWLQGGTLPKDAGQLLELYGVPCHQHYGADVESLIGELARGHKVIVGLDGGEIWKQDPFFEEWLRGPHADHAVVVTGVDLSDPSRPLVYLNDPGEPGGAGRAYPLEDFLQAWADSGNMYVATDHAPGELASHPLFGANFDPASGMYIDAAFWLELLHQLQHQLLTPVDAVKLFEGQQTAPSIHSQLSAWEGLDDEARNRLFHSL